MLSQEYIQVKLYDFALGMIENLPAYKIDHRALAYALNLRVEDGELRTAAGRQFYTQGGALQGSTNILGIGSGERTDGTRDVVVASNAGIWQVLLGSSNLVSKVSRGSVVSAGDTTVVSGNANTRFTADVITATDYFYMSADGPTKAVQIVSAISNSQIQLVSAYAGSTVSGAYYIWKRQATNRTRLVKWWKRWFVADGTNRIREWDTSANDYRDTGMMSAASPVSAVASGAGGLTLSSTYIYKVCWEDVRGRYGNPSPAVSCASGNAGWTLSGWGGYPAWAVYARVYRTSADGTTCYYRARTALSAATWTDVCADGALTTTEAAPANNYQPVTGAEDIIFFKDHLFVMRGSEVRICGLSVWDDHAGDPPGYWQPEYDPGRTTYLGRDSKQQKDGMGFFILNGKLYALQSDGIYRLRDESWEPDVWTWEKVSDVGCLSRWTVQTGPGPGGVTYAYWLGLMGGRIAVVRYDGMQPVNVGRPMEPILEAITATSACAAGVGKGYYRMSVWTTSAIELEYNTDTGNGRGAWSVRDWRHEAYASDPVSAFGGGDNGHVYQLETGAHDAGSAQSYQADFAAVSEPQGAQQSIREYPKHWSHMQLDFETKDAAATLSASYRVDGGSWLALSAYAGCSPISAAADKVKIHRCMLPNDAKGRDIQIRLQSAGTSQNYRIRGMKLAAKPEYGIESRNSSGGAL